MLRSRSTLATLACAAAATAFPHQDGGPGWLSGQVNAITQVHPAFSTAYSGANRFAAEAQAATSHVATVYSGLQLTPLPEVILHAESSARGGLGDAPGLAGFTDLDVVRNPALGSVPYLARIMVRPVSGGLLEP